VFLCLKPPRGGGTNGQRRMLPITRSPPLRCGATVPHRATAAPPRAPLWLAPPRKTTKKKKNAPAIHRATPTARPLATRHRDGGGAPRGEAARGPRRGGCPRPGRALPRASWRVRRGPSPRQPRPRRPRRARTRVPPALRSPPSGWVDGAGAAATAHGVLRMGAAARASSAAAARPAPRSVAGIGFCAAPRRRVARSVRRTPLRVGSGGAGVAAMSPSSAAPPCCRQRKWLTACREGARRGAVPGRPPCTPGRRCTVPPRPRPRANMGASAGSSPRSLRGGDSPHGAACPPPPFWSPLRACGRPEEPSRRRQVDCGRVTEAARAPRRNRIRHV